MMTYDFTEKCQRDLKKLLKRYRSLKSDIEIFSKAIEGVDFAKNKKFIVLHTVGKMLIVKARLFCESLRKGSLRVIFNYDTESKSVIYIEVYFKGDKTREDKQRILGFTRAI